MLFLFFLKSETDYSSTDCSKFDCELNFVYSKDSKSTSYSELLLFTNEDKEDTSNLLGSTYDSLETGWL